MDANWKSIEQHAGVNTAPMGVPKVTALGAIVNDLRVGNDGLCKIREELRTLKDRLNGISITPTVSANNLEPVPDRPLVPELQYIVSKYEDHRIEIHQIINELRELI